VSSLSDGLDFDGRVVVVTGGTRGIGRAITEEFLAAGAQVVACGRTQPVTDLSFAPGHRPSFVQADVRDPEQAAQLVETAVERFGRIDVLVNNAGGAPSAPAAKASPRFVTSVVTLNLLAPFFCAQAANAAMQDQDTGGSVLNIGSVSGLRPSPGSAAYGAAKAGLINLTRTLAVEWAPKVRVNCVIGGLIATEAADDHYGGSSGVEAVAATVPLGRLGTPRDVAGTCLFLASPLAAYISGATIEVHGGGESPAYLSALE
jgi:NAD(P)-dependent dehydrogenase (short-subunit alcohol dehydrogenase family)